MQTLVYIIGGYCLIKAVFLEALTIAAVSKGEMGSDQFIPAVQAMAFLFLAAIEAFNQ